MFETPSVHPGLRRNSRKGSLGLPHVAIAGRRRIPPIIHSNHFLGRCAVVNSGWGRLRPDFPDGDFVAASFVHVFPVIQGFPANLTRASKQCDVSWRWASELGGKIESVIPGSLPKSGFQGLEVNEVAKKLRGRFVPKLASMTGGRAENSVQARVNGKMSACMQLHKDSTSE